MVLSRRHSFALRAALGIVVCCVAGCPTQSTPERDVARSCVTHAECNPETVLCGSIYPCIRGACATSRTIVACIDGQYPDAPTPGNCLSYEDCNPAPRCGLVVNCVDFRCDRDGPRLEVPCSDAGDAAANDATPTDAQADADSGIDAGTDIAADLPERDATSDAEN